MTGQAASGRPSLSLRPPALAGAAFAFLSEGRVAMEYSKIPKRSKRWCRLGAKFLRYLKRRTAKRSRRLGKQLLDDAPMRVTKGWAD